MCILCTSRKNWVSLKYGKHQLPTIMFMTYSHFFTSAPVPSANKAFHSPAFPHMSMPVVTCRNHSRFALKSYIGNLKKWYVYTVPFMVCLFFVGHRLPKSSVIQYFKNIIESMHTAIHGLAFHSVWPAYWLVHQALCGASKPVSMLLC